MPPSVLGRFAGAGVVLALGFAPVEARSVEMPTWDIGALCGIDSARGQCTLLEREARRALSGGWEAVPPELRSACLADVKSPYDKSYRLLSSCLEHRVLAELDKDIIDTASTAGSWQPLASPVKVATAVAAQAPTLTPAPPPAITSTAIAWPYVSPTDQSVAEDAKRRAAIAAELAAATKAREAAEAEAMKLAQAAPQAPASVTVPHPFAWPYVDPADASVAEDAKRRAAIAAELAAATKARVAAEAEAAKAAAAAPKPATSVTVPHPFAWPYVDPADPSVAEDAKRRAAIAAELAAATKAREAAEAAAIRKREAARACQAAIDAAAKSGVILFKSSSAQIDPKSAATLGRLAEAAQRCENVRIRIAGHTDATGSEERNQKLSEDRARAVADYLGGKGVDKARLEAEGFGESKPITSNDTPAGRAKNRRIEFTVSTD